MSETWLPIEGFEGFYEVSNRGEVRALKTWRGPRKIPRVLRPAITHKGYYRVSLQRKGLKKNAVIHRLVAKAFIPRHYRHPEVNHINGDKLDNRVENLEWCTHLQNMKHAHRNGLYFKRKKENGLCVLTADQVLEIRTMLIEMSAAEVSRRSGVSYWTICNIKQRRTWAWL